MFKSASNRPMSRGGALPPNPCNCRAPPDRAVPTPLRCLLPALTAALLAAGCATVTGTADQVIQIRTVDSADRPVAGLRCHASNAMADYYGNSPMIDLKVRRSSSDLLIECKGRGMVARGTAISRGNLAGLAAAVLPGGTAMLMIDYITGYSQAYPGWIQLRIGEDLVFDASNDVAGQPTRALQANRQ